MSTTHLNPTQLLPAEMADLLQRSSWTPDLRSAVLVCLFTGDQLAVRDFFDTLADWADRDKPLARQVDAAIACYSPADVWSVWQVACQWAATVQQPSFDAVIGDATEWTPDLIVEAFYGLDEHAAADQLVELTRVLGHPEIPETTRLGGDLDPEGITRALAEVASPRQVRDAWVQRTTAATSATDSSPRAPRAGREPSLTAEQVTDLAERGRALRHLPRYERWHSNLARELIQLLREHRANGVLVATLAECVGFSAPWVSYLASIKLDEKAA